MTAARRPVAAATAVALGAALLAAVWIAADVAGSASPATTALAAETEPIRDTEQEALAAAAKLDKPVEIASARSESHTLKANPDGTLTAVDYAHPVRTYRDGKWVQTDDRLVKAADGSFTPKASVVGLRISGGGGGPLVAMTRAGRSLSLSWPGTLPEPQVEGDAATYAEVLPGVDLVVHADVDGFSHALVVKTAEAARQSELRQIEFPLEQSGLTVAETTDGGLVATDKAAGGAVFEASAPQMWDAGAAGGAVSPSSPAATPSTVQESEAPDGLTEEPSDSSQIAGVGVEVGDDTMTLEPDQDLLTDPGTAFPVVIDPLFKTSNRAAWTMIASGYPNEEYYKFDGKAHEGVGSCPVVDGTCNDVNVKRLLYRMPTSTFVGKDILKAAFHVTLYHTYDSTARPVRLYRTNGFSSATNWSNKPDFVDLLDTVSPDNPTQDCGADANTEFNAIDAVRWAADGAQSTVSFGLRADDESNYRQWKRFCDNAYLEVTYNTTPDVPLQSKMTMSPGGSCVSGSSRPSVNPLPKLSVVATDPDNSSAHAQSVQVRFRVEWTAADGSAKTFDRLSVFKTSGTIITYQITAGDGVPANTVIGWFAQVGDQSGKWSAWSWTGDQTRCEFVYDTNAPIPPVVTSTDYPEDTEDAADGVGVYGAFTFDSASSDVVSYWYGFNADASASHVLTPAAPGGAVSVSLMPVANAPNFVYVRALDSAGILSAPTVYGFMVESGRPATGAWMLADNTGEAQAADKAAGDHPATAGSGVTFGAVGPGGNHAAVLDGSTNAYLAPDANLINTGTGFSVSAWVRLADTTRDRAAVSTDGTGVPGFTLGYSAAAGAWTFAAPVTDTVSLGTWQAVGPAPTLNEWTHLAGVFDQVTGTMTLYVNSHPYASAARQSRWRSYGAVQIGRAIDKSGYTANWSGALAEVRVFDRIVVPTEVVDLFKLPPKRLGYWPFSTVVNGVSPEATGGAGITLSGGASIYTPADELFDEPALVGTGHLVLDGTSGYAAAAGPVASTTDSFTITARVRLASSDPEQSMTVFSEPATATSAVRVRYEEGGTWQLIVTATDPVGTTRTTTVDSTNTAVAADPSGQHLALVYDGFDDKVRLYVDGALAVTGSAPVATPWAATGGFQVGRALVDGTWGEYLSGAVDDVRIYQGVADKNLIERISVSEERPTL